MKVQITLDELLNLIMARLDAVEVAVEDLKVRMNILMRVVYNSAKLGEEEWKKAVEDELAIMKKAGMLENFGEDEVHKLTSSMLRWLKGDVEEIKKVIENYRKKIEEMAKKTVQSKSIDIASPDLLHRLDALKNRKDKGLKGM